MEYENKNGKPYFIAIVVLLIIITIGILLIFLMPEVIENII